MHILRIHKAAAVVVAAGLVLALAGAALGAGKPVFPQPGMIVSVGQSSDAAIVKVLLNTKMKLGLAYKPTAQAGDLAGLKTVILVVGASAKGLGAAGLDLGQEIRRTEALLKAAREKGIKVLVMHTGGQSRRGKSSNDLIEVAMREADAAVVVAAGNADRFFNKLAEKRGIPVFEVAKINDAGEAVKELFPE